MRPVRIIVMAKAPMAGYAKTRMIPRLGAEGAARFARQLLLHTLRQAQAAAIGPVELCVAPDLQHPLWSDLGLPASLNLSEQGNGDLGERLARAARRGLTTDSAILLIGTDCPALTSDRLRGAAAALMYTDSVLVPVADGGYALLGLNRFAPSLFEAIPWSTNRVADVTRARIESMGWRLWQGKSLHDMDEPDDLCRLPDGWPDPGLAASPSSAPDAVTCKSSHERQQRAAMLYESAASLTVTDNPPT